MEIIKATYFFCIVYTQFIFSQVTFVDKNLLERNYVSNVVGGGRLGDHLVSYCKAKYFSCKYNLPLLLNPFPFSQLFSLFNNETHYDDIKFQAYIREGPIKNGESINRVKTKKVLFFVDMYTALIDKSDEIMLHQDEGAVPYDTFFWVDEIYQKMMENSCYYQEIKKGLSPVTPEIRMKFPQEAISVAVHIRNGGGYDGPLSSQQIEGLDNNQNQSSSKITVDKTHPLKFPPEQFYIEQLINLSELLDNRPMIVYIFTDHLNPSKLMEKIKKKCNKSNLVFSCSDVPWASRVTDDLFLMAQFDCLIRSCSNFAGVAQLLGNHKIIIFPRDYEWNNNFLHICKTSIIIFDERNFSFKELSFDGMNYNELSLMIKEII